MVNVSNQQIHNEAELPASHLYSITLPSGGSISEGGPVVVIGPNGSGKTRQTRQISSSMPIEFISALRNTRVSPDLPAMGVTTARANFSSQKAHAQSNPWELSSEFDYMLSELLAQQSMAAIDFTRRFRENPKEPGDPLITPLTRVEDLWSKVFPGRELRWNDWKPVVHNEVDGVSVEYSGNQMSDGEKAALYLAGRVFSSSPGILVVDEPETHIHSLLAVRLWDALEDACPDVRFVYVTHDLSFALSRRNARYVLANPTEGLRVIEVDESLPSDIARELLGSASFSFYATRIIFCEGVGASHDADLYASWFSGADTVVRSVGSCQRVLRCSDALSSTHISTSLTAVGVIDSDYWSNAFRENLPEGVHMLSVHEVESLYCVEGVVSAVCTHLGRPLDSYAYLQALRNTVADTQINGIAIDRWKAAIEPKLSSLVSGVVSRKQAVGDLITDLPNVFDHTSWTFNPAEILQDEKDYTDRMIRSGSIDDLLLVAPGKQMVSVAARQCGLQPVDYRTLVRAALSKNSPSERLTQEVVAALTPLLPPRHVAVAVASTPTSS